MSFQQCLGEVDEDDVYRVGDRVRCIKDGPKPSECNLATASADFTAKLWSLEVRSRSLYNAPVLSPRA